MNALFTNWQTTSLWQVAGWTMCYFLILGTLITLLGAAVRYLCNRAAPSVRYTVSLAVFAALAISPIAVAAWLTQATPTKPTAQSAAPQTQPTIDLAKIPLPAEQKHIVPPSGWDKSPTAAPQPTTEQSHPKDGTMYALDWAVAYLPWLWILGTPLTFALLATGLVGSERLRRTCNPLTDGPIIETLARLRASLGMGKRVAVAACDRIAQPVLVGIVRPLILLPSSAITGWTPEQLEMVLLHELAHVRRWDNLVNLLQRIVESLLFFHPAVWLVSRQVRRDREQCCDAVVVAHTAKPRAYAELLVSIAASPPPLAGLALARHPLTARIRRILKLEDEPMLVSRKSLGFITLAAAALVAVALWQPATRTIAEEPTTSEVVNAEDAESAEEKDVSADEQLYQFEADTPPSEIEKVISKLEAQGLTLHMHKEDGGAITIRAKNGGTIVVEETNGVPPTGGKAPPAIPVFLPLEQQKIVDQAYKMLGVELGLPGPEELALAKENKFEGGLVINAGPSVFGGGGGGGGFVGGSGPFWQGDLLVGLHVWPIKSLEDVAAVLLRDDIAELSPLKFFVLRGGGRGGGFPSEVELVTGRVPVNLLARYGPSRNQESSTTEDQDAARSIRGANEPLRIAPADELLVRVEGEFPDQQIVDTYSVGPNGALPLGPTYGRVDVNGMTLPEAEDAVTKHLEQMLSDVQVQISWMSPKRSEATLLYDGKTFDQWREIWKTELKTEKRTECIQALAAFGRAGYGKEAAEAILDVAGEYDFSSLENSTEGQLKERVLELLSQRLSESLWLPPLLERYNSNPEQWKWLATGLLGRINTLDDQTRQRLLELANSDDDLHREATLALLRTDSDLERPETVELARRSLQGEKPDIQVLALLGFQHLDRVPEQFELLFHDDFDVRASSRRILSNLSISVDPTPIVERLFNVLDDSEESGKHLYAIRSFVSLGDALSRVRGDAVIVASLKKPLVARLKQIAWEGDERLLGPAIYALNKQFTERIGITIDSLIKHAGDSSSERKELLSDKSDIETLVSQEAKIMASSSSNQLGRF